MTFFKKISKFVSGPARPASAGRGFCQRPGAAGFGWARILSAAGFGKARILSAAGFGKARPAVFTIKNVYLAGFHELLRPTISLKTGLSGVCSLLSAT